MSTIWSAAVKWIESNGGYVHPNLQYDEINRQVYLISAENNSVSSTKDDDDNNTTKTNYFDVATTLLKIPDSCLLTLHTVERDDIFGKLLFEVVHSLQTNNDEDALHEKKGDAETGFYNDSQDVILALYLSYLRHQLDESSSQHGNINDNITSSSNSPWQFYAPYLNTLPSSKSTHQCHLPRQWSIETIKHRLQGTSLYNRAIKEKNGIKREYELVKSAWMDKQQHDDEKDTQNIFPSFELYDRMMAVLTSRGFAGLGYDNVDALIPMLDLLNHKRGHAESSGIDVDTKKMTETPTERNGPDVRYERYVNKEDDSVRDDDSVDGKPQTKRQRMIEGSGGVQVSTAHSLISGSILHMTYGSKGNAALLGRYGFCIPNNIEPDGSCNDILELEIKPNQPRIGLQRGPKSYCYAPFVKLLELCRDTDASRGDTCSQHTEEDGMEEEGDGGLDAFLDACDNEQFEDEEEDDDNEDDGFDDYLYNPSNNRSNDLNDGTSSAQSSMISNDLHAIDALKETLQSVRAGLEHNSLVDQVKNGSANEELTAEDQYCSILIQSEMQTINFYFDIASKLRHRLESHTKEEGKTSDETKHGKEQQGNYDQINSVCDAFLSIRYPHLK